MYMAQPSDMKMAYRRLTMMGYDGEHEITVGTVQDVETGRFRGMNFDKVSIHEAVELDWRLHDFIQMQTYRTMRGMRFAVDPRMKEDEMYFLNEGPWIEEMRRRDDDRLDAMRYLLGSFPVTMPEYKGIVSNVTV